MKAQKEVTWIQVYQALLIPLAVALLTLFILDRLQIPLGRAGGRASGLYPGFLVATAVVCLAWAWEHFRKPR